MAENSSSLITRLGNARRHAKQAAREERALELAEKSHVEARRQRIMTAWSLGIAVVALIVAVIAIFAG